MQVYPLSKVKLFFFKNFLIIVGEISGMSWKGMLLYCLDRILMPSRRRRDKCMALLDYHY